LKSGSRDDSETRFEEEALSFHKKVRNGFLELAGIEPERFRVIDASKNETQVKDKIIEILSSDFGV
jgi:dTMP kinase